MGFEFAALVLLLLFAGADERVRPGWEKGSADSLPQRLPILGEWKLAGGGVGRRNESGRCVGLDYRIVGSRL